MFHGLYSQSQNLEKATYNANQTTFHLFDSIVYVRSNMSLLNGIIIKYNQENKKVFECQYVDGKKDGSLKVWCSNGNIVFSASYKNDLPNGLFQWWYPNGDLKARCFYKNGTLDGKAEAWHNAYNQLMYEENYVDGRMCGIQRYYNEDGKYLGGGNLQNGSGTLEFISNSEGLKILANYTDGKLQGEVSYFSFNGGLLRKNNYFNGDLDGMQIEIKNGNIIHEVHYLVGQKNGLERVKDESEKLTKEYDWLDGKLLSSKYYDENGKVIIMPDDYVDWNALELELDEIPYEITIFDRVNNYLKLREVPGFWCYEIELKNLLLNELFDSYGDIRYCTFE